MNRASDIDKKEEMATLPLSALGAESSQLEIKRLLTMPFSKRVTWKFVIAVLLAALSGFGIAATSLVALLVSEQTKLFGFMESNYRLAIIVAIASEAAAAVILLLVFIANWEGLRPVRRPKAPLADHSQPSAGTP